MFKPKRRKTMFTVQCERVREEREPEPEPDEEEPVIIKPKRVKERLPGVKLLRQLSARATSACDTVP